MTDGARKIFRKTRFGYDWKHEARYCVINDWWLTHADLKSPFFHVDIIRSHFPQIKKSNQINPLGQFLPETNQRRGPQQKINGSFDPIIQTRMGKNPEKVKLTWGQRNKRNRIVKKKIWSTRHVPGNGSIRAERESYGFWVSVTMRLLLCERGWTISLFFFFVGTVIVFGRALTYVYLLLKTK